MVVFFKVTKRNKPEFVIVRYIGFPEASPRETREPGYPASSKSSEAERGRLIPARHPITCTFTVFSHFFFHVISIIIPSNFY